MQTPRGFVLLVGPDGAGKTTVLDALERQLGEVALVRAHHRPGMIAGRPRDGAPVTDPHAEPPRGTLGSIGKLAIVFLDTLLGTWGRWRPAARDGLLVVERGWFDMAVDPRRYRLPERSAPVVRVLGRLLPRADLAVVLTGDPDVLHERKPEIGTDEVRRQLRAWRVLAPRAARRTIEVDTVGQAPEAAARQVRHAIGRLTWRQVPVAPRRLDLRATGPGPALTIYRPLRPTVRRASRWNETLLRMGVARRADAPDVPKLEEMISLLEHPIGHLAAFRSSRPGRWVVGVSDGQSLRTVIKVGADDDSPLRNEILVLERLDPPSGYLLPTPVIVSDDGAVILATSALPLTGEEPTLDQVADLCTALVNGAFGVPACHGDLAPWNCVVVDGAIAVWDWEEARLGEPLPFHDLTHYVIRAGRSLGRWSPAEAIELLAGPESPGYRHAVDTASDDPYVGIAGYLDRTDPSSSAERDYRRRLRRLLTAREPQ